MYRFSFIVLIFLIIGSRKPTVPLIPKLSLDFEEEIGGEDDPLARYTYELSLVADPQTGKIPDNIREKEIQFQASIPSRLEFNFLREHRVQERAYQSTGPFNVGGRTRAAIIDVRNENTIIAGGVSGGIWKTTNGGNEWTRVSDPELTNSITCMAQDTRTGKENIIYAGTGELVGNSPRSLAAPYRGNGLFKSVDGGDSWQQITSTNDAELSEFSSQFQYSWKIVTNPFNPSEDELFLAAFGGILRSPDGGDTWSTVLGESLFDLGDDQDLNDVNAPCYTNIIQTDDGYYFATLSRGNCSGNDQYPNGGIYFSVDGVDWKNITPAPVQQFDERTVMAYANNQAYFLTQGFDELVTLLRYDLTNVVNGQPTGNWTNLSDNIPNFGGEVGDYNSQSSYNMLIDIHPSDPNVVYIGGTNLYRSTDGFTSTENTQWIGGYHPDNDAARYDNHHPDQHLLVFYPSNPDKMLSCNDGGVRLTQNNRADSVKWTTLNNGFITSQFYAVSQQKDESNNLVIGGMQDNGVYIRSAPGINPPWHRLISGDGGPSYITPDQHFFYSSIQNGQIYRMTLDSEYDLSSFARVDPSGGGTKPGQGYLFINPYVLDPLNHNRMYLLGGNVIWRNDNLAQITSGSQKPTSTNWEMMEETELALGRYTAISKSGRSDLVYAGGWYVPSVDSNRSPEVYLVKITDNSTSSQKEDPFLNTEEMPSGAHIVCIALDPEDDDHIIVVFSNYNIPSLYESHDGGITFTDIGGNLEENPDGTGNGPSIRWAEIIPTHAGQLVFVGTSVGLFSTENTDGANTTWVKESPEMIGKSVVTSLDYRSLDGRLVVGTHGNGTFEVNIEDFKTIEGPTNENAFVVSNVYPNPTSDIVKLDYELPEDGVVRADIFNSLGQLEKNLIWAPQYAGKNRITWDGTNSSGSYVRNGIYYCQIRFQDQKESKKVVLIR